MKKRLTCLLLVLAMVLAMVPAALAEEESQLLASSLTDNGDGTYTRGGNTTPLALVANANYYLALYYGTTDSYLRVTDVAVKSGPSKITATGADSESTSAPMTRRPPSRRSPSACSRMSMNPT